MVDKVFNIGSQRELMIDDALVEKMEGVELQLQKPVPRELAIEHDAPWEGNTSGYHTVFQDGDLYKMYYRGSHYDEETGKSGHEEVTCYAESRDGIHWDKPELGLVDFNGSKANNIILHESKGHCFAPFKDGHPDCAVDVSRRWGQDGKSAWDYDLLLRRLCCMERATVDRISRGARRTALHQSDCGLSSRAAYFSRFSQAIRA